MPSDRPNILLITSDQQCASTLGVVNERIRTPHLDRLAREGMRFDRAYCNNPTCSPSRATIVTGLYPAWHHCWTIGVKLPEEVPTIGDLLGARGYATALIGKAHFQPLRRTEDEDSWECQPRLRELDFWRGFHGPWYGFQHVEVARNHADESHAGQHYAIWLEEHGLANWRDYFAPWPPDPRAPRREHHWDLPERFHYSVWTAERAIASIEQAVAQGRPFFLWASFQDPHDPYLAPVPWDRMYRPEDMRPGQLVPGELERMPPYFCQTQEEHPDFSRYQETPQPNHGFHSHRIDPHKLRQNMAVYYGMVSLMDREIGRILAALERLGVAGDTLVVFASDHGHFFGEHGLITKGPFHYDELLRVPMIARFPGRIPAGRVSTALQALIDVPATFLAAAGVPVPGLMQGVNQLPVWCGQVERVRNHVIVENRHQPTVLHLRTYIDDRYKLTVHRDQEYGELFDRATDPGEHHNRWDDPAYAEVKLELLRRFLNAELCREPMRYPRIATA